MYRNNQNRLKKGLFFLEDILKKLYSHSLKKPMTIIAIFFVFYVLSLSVIPQLKLVLNMDEWIDPDFSTYEELHALKKNFLDQDELFFILRKPGHEFLNKDELCSVRGWIQRTVDTRYDLKAILATTSILKPIETDSSFRFQRILDIDCVNKDKEESQAIGAGQKELNASPWKGTFTSRKGDDVSILIYPAPLEKSSFFGKFNPKIVEELIESFKKEVLKKHEKLKLITIGDGIFQYHLRAGYEVMFFLNILMSFIIIVLFRLFLGTFKSGLIFVTLMSWLSLFVYAGMAAVNYPIDVLSSSLSLLILISSLEDFLFVSFLTKKMSWEKAFQKLLLPSFFTSLTTMLGFGSLMFADLGVIRDFGFWAAVSAFFEWVLLFLVFPAMLKKFKFLQNWMNEKKSVSFSFNYLKLYPRFRSTLLLLVVFPVGFLAVKNLYISDSPERLFKESHPARQGLNIVEKTRGWRASLSLVFKDYEDFKTNRSIIKRINEWPRVEAVEDMYSTLDFLTKDFSDFGKDRTEFILEQSTLGQRLGPNKGASRAVIYVRNLDIQEINGLRHRVKKELCPKGECWLAGSLVSYGELGDRALHSFYKSLGGSLILVGLVILFLSLALAPKFFFPLIFSSMWGPVALLCVFYIFNVPVFYVTSMIASILVGIAGDNAIQFLLFSKDEPSLELDKGVLSLSPASSAITVSMVFACTIFFFGYFAPMQTLGMMLIVGLLLSLFGDIWILRGLLNFKKK